MYDQTDVRELIGSDLHASDDKVGRIGQIFLDDQTGKPEWATVNTGFFGTSESFVPLADAHRADGGLAVPYSKSQIKDAPNVDPESGHLSEDQEAELYRHYGLQYSEARSDSGLPDGHAGTTGTDTTRTGTDESMVRREEELNVDKEKVRTGQARLRKYVVTEDETVTVPVRKEKVRLEREPLTDEDRAAGAGTISEGDVRRS